MVKFERSFPKENKTSDAPDTVLAGYLANPKAIYRISGSVRIPDICPDSSLNITYLTGYPAVKSCI
jgi:NMD protein affecting ribosome stability and mRNA decay